jgi:hypothetical protein
MSLQSLDGTTMVSAMSTLAFTDTFDLLMSDFAPGFVVAVVPATVVAVASTTVVPGSAAFLVRAIDEPACVSELEEQAPMTRHRAVCRLAHRYVAWITNGQQKAVTKYCRGLALMTQ